jgi:nitrite reductase/ring-hydroxylating ferredoxin subunit
MERREFIRSGCGYCAGLAAFSVLGSLLEGCAPSDLIYKAEFSGNKIMVPSEKLIGKKYLVVRSSALDYDLLLVKENENSYHTLAMQCTHRQQPLVVTSTGLVCNEHGSRFDLDGNVTQDPASQPLLKFKTETGQGSVIIYLR